MKKHAKIGRIMAALIVSSGLLTFQAKSLPPDFVFRHSSYGYDTVWFMDNIYEVGTKSVSPDPVSDLNWRIVGTGDFNADGLQDLVWQHSTLGQIVVWFMNGTAMVSNSPFNPGQVSDLNWRIVGVADFNSDGKPDLLWQHQTIGQIAIWYMNGINLISNTVTSPDNPGDINWKVVGTADFNSDGKPDLLWQHQTSGDVAIWYMNGATLLSTTLTTPSNPGDINWKIVSAADLNYDGKPDLLWQHSDSSIAIWWMNGAVWNSPTMTEPSSPGSGWRIVATGDFGPDADNDGLPDWWELQLFGNLSSGPNNDPDGDGLTNSQEYSGGTNPNQALLKVKILSPRNGSTLL